MRSPKKAGGLGLLLCGLLFASSGVAEAKPSAQVSFLKGKAQVLRSAGKYGADLNAAKNAPWKAVKVGTTLNQGDAVRTEARTRLEMKVPDGSRVRLGSKSSLVLSQGHFSKGGKRKVTFTLWLGRVWAKVAKRAGAGSSFEVKTQNAVAGVRGTSFAVMASLDSSSVVKVYTGSVGVKKNETPGAKTPRRREVAGPQRIDKKQWEEVIATAMTQVKVTNLGQIQPAEDFVDEGEDLQWAMWNKERDAAIQ